jgi:hypothetical protein
MFFSLQVDRGNLSQAVAGTLLQDLKLTTNGMLPSSGKTESELIFDRLQLRKHCVLGLVPASRVTIPTCLEEAGSRSMDSHPNLLMCIPPLYASISFNI